MSEKEKPEKLIRQLSITQFRFSLTHSLPIVVYNVLCKTINSVEEKSQNFAPISSYCFHNRLLNLCAAHSSGATTVCLLHELNLHSNGTFTSRLVYSS